jgi:hypothetical protein
VVQAFDFAFDPRFRGGLAVFGIRPDTCRVEVDQAELRVRFGAWRLSTAATNIARAEQSGPYRWYTAIGPRLSLADRGATFGTTPAGGVCIIFHEPVAALFPARVLRHPGLTVTVADPAGLVAALSATHRNATG